MLPRATHPYRRTLVAPAPDPDAEDAEPPDPVGRGPGWEKRWRTLHTAKDDIVTATVATEECAMALLHGGISAGTAFLGGEPVGVTFRFEKRLHTEFTAALANPSEEDLIALHRLARAPAPETKRERQSRVLRDSIRERRLQPEPTSHTDNPGRSAPPQMSAEPVGAVGPNRNGDALRRLDAEYPGDPAVPLAALRKARSSEPKAPTPVVKAPTAAPEAPSTSDNDDDAHALVAAAVLANFRNRPRRVVQIAHDLGIDPNVVISHVDGMVKTGEVVSLGSAGWYRSATDPRVTGITPPKPAVNLPAVRARFSRDLDAAIESAQHHLATLLVLREAMDSA